MFVGREKEMETLNRLYTNKKFEFMAFSVGGA
jgi:AAA+ ATPase superfamily predicted ATPase